METTVGLHEYRNLFDPVVERDYAKFRWGSDAVAAGR